MFCNFLSWGSATEDRGSFWNYKKDKKPFGISKNFCTKKNRLRTNVLIIKFVFYLTVFTCFSSFWSIICRCQTGKCYFQSGNSWNLSLMFACLYMPQSASDCGWINLSYHCGCTSYNHVCWCISANEFIFWL